MQDKEKDKKADKISRFLSGMALLEEGETITPTAFAKRLEMHPNTIRLKNDEYELAKAIGWRTIYDKDGFAKLFIKEDNNVYFMNQITEIKQEIQNIKNILQDLKVHLKKKVS